MLRIQRIDGKNKEAVLLLQGWIVEEWSDLLARECRQMRESGLEVVLDLSGVVFLGRSGLDALRRISEDGVRITECPPLIAEMIEQEGIAVDRTTGSTAPQEDER